MSSEQQVFFHLGIALALGLLIGIERGWQERSVKEGERVAGVRTFGLIGLLGGISALLAQQFYAAILALVFMALAMLMTAVYISHHKRQDMGITSLVASLLTFMYGALAVLGMVQQAAAAAVVTTLLLSYKPLLHHWLDKIEAQELKAGLKLLLISVVLLPVLPNQGYGPWQALNPYTIWWMVVMIAAISFAGYVAIKLAGANKGVLFTALFGGLASSTAITLNFSRLAANNREAAPILAMGVLLACGTMVPRIMLVAVVFSPRLFDYLLWPGVVMTLLICLPALAYWRTQSRMPLSSESLLSNPLELKTALIFGALLTLIMLLGQALYAGFGDAGVMMLSAVSGVADVDAVTLLLAQMSQQELSARVAASGIILAAAVNSLVKGGISLFIGGKAIGFRVASVLLGSGVIGVLVVWWQ